MLTLPELPKTRIRRRHLRKYSWLPDVFRIKGSVIPRILGPVLTVTLWAVLIAYLSSAGYDVSLTNSVIPLLSVVVGLILVFRNSTSYDRFWEGRKSFASLTSQARNLSRMIWLHVALPPTDEQPSGTKGRTPKSDVTQAKLHRKKADVLRLIALFVVSVKHYVRGEDGLHWDDYQDFVPSWFLRYALNSVPNSYDATRADSLAASVITTGTGTGGTNSPERSLRPPKGDATKRVRPKRSKQRVQSFPNDTTALLPNNTQSAIDFFDDPDETIPLPLIIAHEINKFLFECRKEGFLETVGPAGVNSMNQLVQGMVDQMTAVERVANTPIPVAYSIHLKQCVTLYLFALPMTLVRDLGWMTIPIVTVVAFTFMGIEGIADQIEMPFGSDTGDLPLDRYCKDLKEEINFIIERLPQSGEGMHGYDDGEGDD